MQEEMPVIVSSDHNCVRQDVIVPGLLLTVVYTDINSTS